MCIWMQSRWHIPKRPSDVGANLNAEPVTHPQKGWRWYPSECSISYISSSTTTESVTHPQRGWRWCPSECRIISWWCEQRFGTGFFSRLLTLMPIWMLNQWHFLKGPGDTDAHLNSETATHPQKGWRWCPSECRISDTSTKGRAMLMPIWMQNHCPGGDRAVFSVQASSVACIPGFRLLPARQQMLLTSLTSSLTEILF